MPDTTPQPKPYEVYVQLRIRSRDRVFTSRDVKLSILEQELPLLKKEFQNEIAAVIYELTQDADRLAATSSTL